MRIIHHMRQYLVFRAGMGYALFQQRRFVLSVINTADYAAPTKDSAGGTQCLALDATGNSIGACPEKGVVHFFNVAEIAEHKHLEMTRSYCLLPIEDRENAMEGLQVEY